MIKKYLTLMILSALLFACGGSDDATEKTVVTDSTEVIENLESDLNEVTEEKAGYEINDYATDFSLMNIDDQLVSLSDYEDVQGFIIVFTCNHCPYAVAYEDRIIALDKKYKELGYPVIAINPNDPAVMEDDSFEKMKERAAEKGFTFPYLLDDGQEIYPQYGATKTPHVYILEKLPAGNSVAYIGTIDDNYEDESAVTVRYIEDAVDALLKGETPLVTETVAIGCSIKS